MIRLHNSGNNASATLRAVAAAASSGATHSSESKKTIARLPACPHSNTCDFFEAVLINTHVMNWQLCSTLTHCCNRVLALTMHSAQHTKTHHYRHD